MDNTRWTKGYNSEKSAIKYLQSQNFEILKHRYLSPYGEVDIIAKKGTLLIAVEIKARANEDTIRESITLRQRKRIENGLLYFTAKNRNYYNYDLRLDVIFYTDKEMIHIPNAWESSGY